MPSPRVIAVGLVIRDNGDLLVTEGADPLTGKSWHRLIGGGVEYGERGADALVREFEEEYGLSVRVGDRLAALENLFTYNGLPGHELVLVYDAHLTDRAHAEAAELRSLEPGQPPGIGLSPTEARLVPADVATLLDRE